MPSYRNFSRYQRTRRFGRNYPALRAPRSAGYPGYNRTRQLTSVFRALRRNVFTRTARRARKQ